MAVNTVLKKSANHPTDDTSTAGGTMSATQITNGATGEFITRMTANASGTLDTNAQKQYQEAYVENLGDSDLADAGVFLDNGLVIPAGAGTFKAQSTSASDDASKTLRPWSEVAGVLNSADEVQMNGVAQVQGALTHVRVFRAGLFNTSTGALETAAGRIDIWVGAELIGHIPIGESWATSEYRFRFAASSGDTGTFANRKTDPLGGSGWLRPNTPATRAPVRNDAANDTLAVNVRNALYCEQTLQPGIEPEPTLKLCLEVYGDDVGA